MSLQVHTPETAPEGSRPILDGAESKMGFVPNLFGVFAGSPAALEGYTTLSGIFDKTSFSPTERQVVLLTVSFENSCDYCMAAHSTIADGQRVSGDVVEALRAGTALEDSKLEALRTFTAAVVRERGFANDAVPAFLEAGYTQAHVLEVILGVAMKTVSNYTNHLAQTPLDEAFSRRAWTAPVGAAD